MLLGSMLAGALWRVFGNVFEQRVCVLWNVAKLAVLLAGNAFEFGNAAELVVRVRERGRAYVRFTFASKTRPLLDKMHFTVQG